MDNSDTSEIKIKIVCLDNADVIPPSAQQILKKVMQDHEISVKFVFICTDKNKLIAYILQKAQPWYTAAMSEKDAITVVLSFCSKESIGYDRDGIHELFKLYKPVSTIYNTFNHMYI